MSIKYSVVIPVYNSEKTIGPLVDEIVRVMGNEGLQIVLVNDGSADDSDGVCAGLSEKYPGIVKYVKLAKNFGEHNAVMAGLNNVDGEYTVIMDDDFQNPPNEALRLLKTVEDGGYDIVYSYYEHKSHDWFRNLGSTFNHYVSNALLDKPKDLYLSSFKSLNRFTVNEIVKYKGPFPYIDGLALRSTSNIGRMKAKHDERAQGESGYSMRKLIRLWLNMFVNFSVKPLRLAFTVGFLFSALGFVLGAVFALEKIIYPDTVVGWTSIIVSVFIFSGVQLLILGIIGEYLGSLYLTSTNKPQFVVRCINGKEKDDER